PWEDPPGYRGPPRRAHLPPGAFAPEGDGCERFTEYRAAPLIDTPPAHRRPDSPLPILVPPTSSRSRRQDTRGRQVPRDAPVWRKAPDRRTLLALEPISTMSLNGPLAAA